jgi:hypothetical protein
MKKRRVITNARVSDLSYDDLMDEISDDLDLKIERFRTRRWRALKNAA